MNGRTIRPVRWSVWTRPVGNCSPTRFHPIPLHRHILTRHGPENVRGGVANIFVANLFLDTEPLRGWRHVTVSEQRTRIDFAYCIRELVDVHYPDAERVVLVRD